MGQVWLVPKDLSLSSHRHRVSLYSTIITGVVELYFRGHAASSASVFSTCTYFVRSDIGTLLVVNEEWLREQEEVSTEELVLDEWKSRSKSQPWSRRQVLQLPQLSAQTVLSPLAQRQWTIVAESSLGAAAGGALLPTILKRRMLRNHVDWYRLTYT